VAFKEILKDRFYKLLIAINKSRLTEITENIDIFFFFFWMRKKKNNYGSGMNNLIF